MSVKMHIAILSAMPEEIGKGLNYLSDILEFNYGDFTIYQGYWINKNINLKVSLAWSGWGKVSAARATTRMIAHSEKEEPIDLFIFTGVAGAIKKSLKQWDILLANKLIQHDMDASPLFEKFIIPQLEIKDLIPNMKVLNWAENVLNIAKKGGGLSNFQNVYSGLIATGDQFINSNSKIKKLTNEINNLYCVEMEGASFAQVALQENIPWLVIRVISDNASEEAPNNFNEFIKKYNESSWGIIEVFLKEVDKLH